MPFKTDGSSHVNGVKNEHTVADLFNSNPPLVIQTAYPGQVLRFEQKGGTGQVDDIEVYIGEEKVTGISTKHHGKSGTFDYIKTSKVMDYAPNIQPLVTEVETFKREHRKQEAAVPVLHALVQTRVNELWPTIQSENIRHLLKVTHERNSKWVCVTTSNGNIIFPHENIKELSLYPYDPEVTYELRKARAQGSRQIWRVKNGEATNTHLRLRILLNNGLRAALGLSSSNSNSSMCVQLQQDNVDGLLRQVVAEQSQSLVGSDP